MVSLNSMEEQSKQLTSDEALPAEGFSNNSKENSSSAEIKKKKKKKKSKEDSQATSDNQEVLLNLPAGFKYRMPGKRQRVIIGSIVVGLNIIFLIAIAVYFYNPSFQEFVYNFARD